MQRPFFKKPQTYEQWCTCKVITMSTQSGPYVRGSFCEPLNKRR